ncbi:Rap1a/Tai family immunity protein [Sphingobium sp. AN558]|uniref:Rap1a/Tai family immunity protein n=1 Tax=Sphingobium sp. AN558 TaxID=3133442 RepID=UPI0030C18DB5
MRLKTLAYMSALCASGFLSIPAEAGYYSGNALMDVCTTERADPTYFEKSYECVAYIGGAVDAFNTTREANKLKSCIPARVTLSRLKDVTVAFLRANPGSRDRSASALVFAATRDAWPCDRKKQK